MVTRRIQIVIGTTYRRLASGLAARNTGNGIAKLQYCGCMQELKQLLEDGPVCPDSKQAVLEYFYREEAGLLPQLQ